MWTCWFSNLISSLISSKCPKINGKCRIRRNGVMVRLWVSGVFLVCYSGALECDVDMRDYKLMLRRPYFLTFFGGNSILMCSIFYSFFFAFMWANMLLAVVWEALIDVRLCRKLNFIYMCSEISYAWRPTRMRYKMKDFYTHNTNIKSCQILGSIHP